MPVNHIDTTIPGRGKATMKKVLLITNALLLLGPVAFLVSGLIAGISPSCAAVVDVVDGPATNDELRHRIGWLVGWSPSRSGEFWLAAVILEMQWVLIGSAMLIMYAGVRRLIAMRAEKRERL